jgi:O-antigen/teichoic acid export membrane protein
MAPFYMSRAGWWPTRHFKPDVARRILTYSKGVTGFNVLNQLARRGDDVLVGAILGTTAVGFYSLSYRFIEAPVMQVSQITQAVTFPALVRVKDEARFRRALLRAQKPLVWLVAPLAVCSLALGDQAVVLVLGTDWSPAGTVLQVFGGIALIQAATTQVGPIYLARDATGLLFKWSLFMAPSVLAGIAVGTIWGIDGVAWAYLAVNLLLFVPNWNVPGRLIGLDAWQVLRSVGLVMGLALAVAAATYGVRVALDIESLAGVIGCAAGATAAYWGLALGMDRSLAREVRALLARAV